jgi:hypothetical protein
MSGQANRDRTGDDRDVLAASYRDVGEALRINPEVALLEID